MFQDTARYCTTISSQFSLEMRRIVHAERWGSFFSHHCNRTENWRSL